MVKAAQTFASRFTGHVMGCDPEGRGARLSAAEDSVFPGPGARGLGAAAARLHPVGFPSL